MKHYTSDLHGNPDMGSGEGCSLISSDFSFSSLNHTIKMLFLLEVWYAMSLGALVVLIMLCHRPLVSHMRLRPLASWERKLAPITSTTVLRVQRFLGCMYIAANGFAMGLRSSRIFQSGNAVTNEKWKPCLDQHGTPLLWRENKPRS